MGNLWHEKKIRSVKKPTRNPEMCGVCFGFSQWATWFCLRTMPRPLGALVTLFVTAGQCDTCLSMELQTRITSSVVPTSSFFIVRITIL